MKESIDEPNMENLLSKRESDNRDRFILIAVLISAFVSVYWFLMSKYAEATESYEIYDSLKYLGYLMSLGMASVPILIALGVKNAKWRTLAIVAGAICAVIRLYWWIKTVFPAEEFEFMEF